MVGINLIVDLGDLQPIQEDDSEKEFDYEHVTSSDDDDGAQYDDADDDDDDDDAGYNPNEF